MITLRDIRQHINLLCIFVNMLPIVSVLSDQENLVTCIFTFPQFQKTLHHSHRLLSAFSMPAQPNSSNVPLRSITQYTPNMQSSLTHAFRSCIAFNAQHADRQQSSHKDICRAIYGLFRTGIFSVCALFTLVPLSDVQNPVTYSQKTRTH